MQMVLYKYLIYYFFYRSLLDPDVDASFPDDGPVTFDEVSLGTKRGGRKLVSSDGFTYTVKVNTILNSCHLRKIFIY